MYQQYGVANFYNLYNDKIFTLLGPIALDLRKLRDIYNVEFEKLSYATSEKFTATGRINLTLLGYNLALI